MNKTIILSLIILTFFSNCEQSDSVKITDDVYKEIIYGPPPYEDHVFIEKKWVNKKFDSYTEYSVDGNVYFFSKMSSDSTRYSIRYGNGIINFFQQSFLEYENFEYKVCTFYDSGFFYQFDYNGLYFYGYRTSINYSPIVGNSIFFHSNGNYKEYGIINQQHEQVGEWKYFDEDGNLKKEVDYGNTDDDFYFPNDYLLYEKHYKALLYLLFFRKNKNNEK